MTYDPAASSSRAETKVRACVEGYNRSGQLWLEQGRCRIEQATGAFQWVRARGAGLCEAATGPASLILSPGYVYRRRCAALATKQEIHALYFYLGAPAPKNRGFYACDRHVRSLCEGGNGHWRAELLLPSWAGSLPAASLESLLSRHRSQRSKDLRSRKRAHQELAQRPRLTFFKNLSSRS